MLLERGLKRYEELIEKYPALADHDETLDEVLMALLHWHYIHEFNDIPVPDNYPLRRIWVREQIRVASLSEVFKRENAVADERR